MRKGLQALAGILLVALPLGLVVFTARSVARWFESLEQDTAVAISGAAAIVAVPVLTYWTNRILERRRSVETATRSKRVELYEEFFAFFGRMFTPERIKQQPTESETVEFMTQMTPRMMAHASNDVVKRWGRFRVSAAGGVAAGDPSMMYAWEDLMKAMRKDLGHSSLGLQRRDLLRLFVNDIDTFGR